MRSYAWSTLGVCVLFGFIGCGGESSPLGEAGGAGPNLGSDTGGSLSSTGGAPGLTGGAPAQTGGAPGLTGGAPAQTGGAPAATGGAPAETGGAPAETGGAPAETGGAAATGGAPSNPSACPAALPGANVACDAQGTQCQYENMTCACFGGQWNCFNGGNNNPQGCPRQAPQNGGNCTGTQSCNYFMGAYTCACSADQWACTAQPNASCPEAQPAAQSSCAGLGGTFCPYQSNNALTVCRCPNQTQMWTCNVPGGGMMGN